MSSACRCSRHVQASAGGAVLNAGANGRRKRHPAAIPQKTMEGPILKRNTLFSSRKLSACCLAVAVLFGTTGGVSIAADKSAASISVPTAPELPQTPETIDRVMQL